jgi:hypothetical protein
VFLVVLCLATLAVVVMATTKTTKLVWPQEKVIPAMLAFLCLSLLGSFAFFSWSLLRIYKWPFPARIEGAPPNPDEACELAIFPFLPVIFLAVAVILNIDKWLCFYFRIMAEHRGNASKARKNLEMIQLESK